ncbi:hypothetical protein MKW92_039499 [Papaver armeniacum]|nr:hypothetical protein MKW92_039499 [Papaver armeniacum]
MSTNTPNDQLLQAETTCGSLLYELQIIWDEVGESDADRDKMLYELEQECLEVYRRKVDQANKSRAQLRQAIADSEAELAAICSAMGERPVHIRQADQKSTGKLKEELRAIIPQLDEMKKRKWERRNQFVEVLDHIQKIANFRYFKLPIGFLKSCSFVYLKSDRMKQVLDHLSTLNSLCLVLGIDFNHTVREVHSSLDDSEGAKNISNDTIHRLAAAIDGLREVKRQRMQKLQDLASSMLELWNLMDTPVEEQQMFQNVTCNIAASEHEITEPNTLSVDFINYVATEVSRLEELKSSKMKELVLKKRSELEEICRRTHMVVEAECGMQYAIEAIESGAIDPASVLEQMELQVAKVKEEAFSRKDILERDDNRYNAGRGAHLTLKPMVEALASKITAWENERGVEFTYDGIRLLSMLEEYSIVRQEKEQEVKRQRDQKKRQGQLIAEQEVLFGSKPSPSKPQSMKKTQSRPSTGGGGGHHRRLSLGGANLQTPKPTPKSTRKSDRRFRYCGLPVKKHSFNSTNAYQTESPMTRKPFSPVTSAVSAKANTANLLQPVYTTPSKVSSLVDEENMTPRVVVPKTPYTPMQTAMTPAPALPVTREIEYSFEERRAGFV